MKSTDKNLLVDEHIIFRTRKHWIIFFTPLVWTVATLFLLLNANPLIVKISGAFAIAAALSWLNQWLSYVSSEFVITNKRIMMKEGFFTRHSNELRLATVSNMGINQSLLGQLLGYGTAIIHPFGGNKDIFTEISYPLEFQKHTQAQLDQILSKPRPQSF